MVLYHNSQYMTPDYWRKQTKELLLFPDLEWSKPENKMHAGKLVIIGGNLHGFAAPATAFTEAQNAGIGSLRVLLPNAIQKIVGTFLPEADFAPSTPSGSFASSSLAEWLDHAAWADAVLLAGDLGRNSETAIVVESFVQKYSGNLTITKDAADYIIPRPLPVLNRTNTTLVISFAQLQKLASNARFTKPFTFDMGLVRLVDILHEFTKLFPVNIVVKYLDTTVVAVKGQISTTKLGEETKVWRVTTAAHVSVWWLQHPGKPFESLTTGVV